MSRTDLHSYVFPMLKPRHPKALKHLKKLEFTPEPGEGEIELRFLPSFGVHAYARYFHFFFQALKELEGDQKPDPARVVNHAWIATGIWMEVAMGELRNQKRTSFLQAFLNLDPKFEETNEKVEVQLESLIRLARIPGFLSSPRIFQVYTRLSSLSSEFLVTKAPRVERPESSEFARLAEGLQFVHDVQAKAMKANHLLRIGFGSEFLIKVAYNLLQGLERECSNEEAAISAGQDYKKLRSERPEYAAFPEYDAGSMIQTMVALRKIMDAYDRVDFLDSAGPVEFEIKFPISS